MPVRFDVFLSMKMEFLPYFKKPVKGFLKYHNVSERSSVSEIKKCLFSKILNKSTILIFQAGGEEVGHLRRRVV